MNNLWLPKICLALLGLLLIDAQSLYAATATASPTGQGVTFVHLLVKQDYRSAYEQFDDHVKHVLPPEQLAAAWHQVTGKLGAFKTTGQTKIVPANGYTAVFVKSIFDHGAIWVQLAYDKSGKIAGIHFLPSS